MLNVLMWRTVLVLNVLMWRTVLVLSVSMVESCAVATCADGGELCWC